MTLPIGKISQNQTAQFGHRQFPKSDLYLGVLCILASEKYKETWGIKFSDRLTRPVDSAVTGMSAGGKFAVRPIPPPHGGFEAIQRVLTDIFMPATKAGALLLSRK